ncbi:MAG: zinc ribbon domain-containing protein [Candidatus Methanoperedens sp.]
MNEKEGRYCSSCGKELAEGMNFCPSCGKAVASKNENGKLEDEGKESEKEEVVPFELVKFQYEKINSTDAKQFFGDYRKYLKDILTQGAETWLKSHRRAYTFPITSHNLDSLSTALRNAVTLPRPINEKELAELRAHGVADPNMYKLADKLEKLNRVPTFREMAGAEFIDEKARQIIIGGLVFASEQYNWQMRYDYQKDVIKRKDLPDLDTFKKDLLNLLTSGTMFSFD